MVVLFGVVALIVGLAVTVLAVSSATAGAGSGSGFQGSIRTVVPLAAPHERAGVVSLLYVVSYLGLGVPAVAAGFLVVHGGGLIETPRYYGGAVILLAAAALIGLLMSGRRARPAADTQPAPAPAAPASAAPALPAPAPAACLAAWPGQGIE